MRCILIVDNPAKEIVMNMLKNIFDGITFARVFKVPGSRVETAIEASIHNEELERCIKNKTLHIKGLFTIFVEV